MSQGSQASNRTAPLSQENTGTPLLSQENNFNASHVIPVTPVTPVTPHRKIVSWRNETPSTLKKLKRRLIPRSSSILLRPTMKYRSHKPFSNKLKHRQITKKKRFHNRLAGEYHNGILHSIYSRGRKIKTLNLSRRSPRRKHLMHRHTHKQH